MIPDAWTPYLRIWLIIRSQKAQCKNMRVMWPLFQQLHNTACNINAMLSYKFYLCLCKCFLHHKNIPAKSVYKVGSCFTNSMIRWKVEGRLGREVRDEDREGEKEGRASIQLLHLGHGRTTDIVAGEPLWRTKSETSGFANSAADGSPRQNCLKCPPHYLKGWKLST